MASLFSSRPRHVVSLASDAAPSHAARASLRSRAFFALKAMLLVGAISVPVMAQTTTLTVTTTADTVNGCSATICTLRDALNAAYGAAGTSNIQFAPGVTGTIALTSTLPGFSGTINLIGPGASQLTIDGGNSSIIGSIFTVTNNAVVTISGVTIAHGTSSSGYGGGVVSYATLTVNNAAFIGNTAQYGGAISESTGTLTINNSTFSGNSAKLAGGGLGGVIMNYTTTTINNSTFFGNSSDDQAAVIQNYGTGVIITNSTFAGNTAPPYAGNAIISYNPGLAVTNSVFADGGTECGGSTACPVTGTLGNVVPADASGLAPLGDYGGFTQTMIPLPGSAAICAATPSLATAAGLTTDQRGFARTNTTYTGYTGSAPCVDAGSVQTHYSSIAFVTQPTNASLNAVISPAPTVEVLENTNTVAGIPITLTFSGTGTLGGTLTQTTGAGITQTSGLVSGSVATFGNLEVSATGSGDTLSTSLTITPAGAAGVTTLSVTSNAFDAGGGVAATQVIASETLTQNQPSATFTPVVGSLGTQPFTYSISPTTLPAGLTFSTSTGTIVGSPTGTFAAATCKVTVTDANSSTASANFSLTVNGPVVATQAVASTTLASGTAATAFTPVTGSGGTGTLTYSVSPALPAGLTFNTSTGTITGTPTTVSAATTYTVTVTDTNGATKTNTFSLTVNGAVAATQVIAAKVLTDGQPPTSFTPVTGAGGSGTLSYSISPALPAGLSISTSTGAVTGSPSVTSAATTYTVTVTDSSNATASSTFSLTVNGPVTATLVVPSEILAVNYAITTVIPVTGAGGTGALTYSVSPALPAGLTFASATGTITGTPTVAVAQTNYTVTVTDANNATASATLTMVVYSAPLSFTFLPTGTSTAQVPLGGSFTYNFAIAPTETIYPGPVTFAVGGLPTGATYTLSTTSLSATAGPQSISLTVKAPSTLARNEVPGRRSPSPMFFAMFLPLVAGLGFRRRIPRALTLALFAVAGVLGMSALSGCGSGSNSQYYVVQVTATSGPSNDLVQQVAYVSLTVE
jgi:CSLREA domain-containing protein